MTKNRTPIPVYLDHGMHSGLEVKGLIQKYFSALRVKISLFEGTTLGIPVSKVNAFLYE